MTENDGNCWENLFFQFRHQVAVVASKVDLLGFLQCKQFFVKFALQYGCRVSFKYFVGLSLSSASILLVGGSLANFETRLELPAFKSLELSWFVSDVSLASLGRSFAFSSAVTGFATEVAIICIELRSYQLSPSTI